MLIFEARFSVDFFDLFGV